PRSCRRSTPGPARSSSTPPSGPAATPGCWPRRWPPAGGGSAWTPTPPCWSWPGAPRRGRPPPRFPPTSTPWAAALAGRGRVGGVVAARVVCPDQLDAPGGGLSSARPAPLDMRLAPPRGEPASTLLRRLSERDLADVLWRYGEERFSRRIARRIVEQRKRDPL